MVNIIEVSKLSKIYSGEVKSAIDNISFMVTKGEIFGILGVNGAGKSTTLNILMDLLAPSSGSIRMFGEDFLKNTSALKNRMNIASAYADLATSLSVEQNLKVYAKMYGVKNPKQKITELLTAFDIVRWRYQRFDHLSAGQKTRVNLCKALINDPELLLLDEPTSSLDPQVAGHVRSMLLDLQKKQQMTIVLTSHNMPEVEQMCSRVALLHQGQIYKIDSPNNLIKFLKVPSMEEVFLKLAHGEMPE